MKGENQPHRGDAEALRKRGAKPEPESAEVAEGAEKSGAAR